MPADAVEGGVLERVLSRYQHAAALWQAVADLANGAGADPEPAS
jgi:hypothetical protein